MHKCINFKEDMRPYCIEMQIRKVFVLPCVLLWVGYIPDLNKENERPTIDSKVTLLEAYAWKRNCFSSFANSAILSWTKVQNCSEIENA